MLGLALGLTARAAGGAPPALGLIAPATVIAPATALRGG